MKKIITVAALLVSSLSFANSNTLETEKTIWNCSNYGDRVNYSFTSCINNNFRSVERDLNIFLERCFNYGELLEYSFVSCVNRNFWKIDHELRTMLYNCNSYNGRPDYSYQSCINNNFRSIYRELRNNQ